uniref:EF-hand domain-containing protein n=1 Tax=Nelumbo nucifera TaxID=4432 RepID=A0A822YK50_NELNU|nr:TPA_asm: hypothetical protein HUJ06_010137 [Nelumbo nucifera]
MSFFLFFLLSHHFLCVYLTTFPRRLGESHQAPSSSKSKFYLPQKYTTCIVLPKSPFRQTVLNFNGPFLFFILHSSHHQANSYYLNMENTSPISTLLRYLLVVGGEYILFHRIMNCRVFRIPELFHSSFLSFLQSVLLFDLNSGKSKDCSSEMNCQTHESSSQQFHDKVDLDDGRLCKGDIEVVMEKLELFFDPHGDMFQEKLGLNEITKLFEDKDPSLDEVKDAFDVFDDDKDGFIDARELQRVLCRLGFREGSEVEQCQRMIEPFDVNGDGRIDFSEFFKFMENSFY